MRLWLPALVVTAALAAPAMAQAQGVPGLEFVAPDKLSVALDGGKASKSVWVRNTTEDTANLEFETLLEDSDGKPKSVVVNPLPASLAAGDEQRIRLTFSTKKQVDGATGELKVTGAGAPGSLELSVSKKTVADRGVALTLTLPLVVAILLVYWAGRNALKHRSSGRPLPASVDFEKSFASGITAVGAIFGTILASSVMPEETSSLSKEGFAALNLVFGIAVVVAGFVYLALQRVIWKTEPEEEQAGKKPSKKQKPKPKAEFQGDIRAFLVACIITVWAVIGELWLTLRLIRELVGGKGFNTAAEVVLLALMLASAVLVALYIKRRLLYTLADPPEGDSRLLQPESVGGVTYLTERRSVSLL
jgi:hypothetical protein